MAKKAISLIYNLKIPIKLINSKFVEFHSIDLDGTMNSIKKNLTIYLSLEYLPVFPLSMLWLSKIPEL